MAPVPHRPGDRDAARVDGGARCPRRRRGTRRQDRGSDRVPRSRPRPPRRCATQEDRRGRAPAAPRRRRVLRVWQPMIAREDALAALAAEHVRRRRRRRRHHRRRRRARRRHARLQRRARREAPTSPRARRAARPSSSTAACATCRTSTSASCARRCSSASSWSRSRRTSSTRCRSSSPPSTASAPTARRRRPEPLRRHGGRAPAPAARPRLRGRAAAQARRRSAEWSPERHRMIPGDEVARAVPALAEREPTSGYLFYDCQTDDARLVLTVLGEAERFGAVCANGVEVTELVARTAAAPRACACATRQRRASSSSAPTTSSTRPACGPTGCAPRSCTTRPRSRASGPAAARTSRCASEDLPLVGGGAIVPGRRRPLDLRPAVARPHADRHDRQRLRGRPDDSTTCRPADEDIEYLLDATNEYFGTSLGPATSPAPTPACGR